jgi:serine phosphatase RsbU (regulator of sigma subunit)
MNPLRTFLLALLLVPLLPVAAQEADVIDDNTRATLILDIAKYIEYDETFDSKDFFIITVLDKDPGFFWTLDNFAAERKFIQGKPIQIYYAPRISDLEESQVIYMNDSESYNIGAVLRAIDGANTLLVTEGYTFRESMINFLVVDGQPRFEANEELMNEYGLHVDELFLAHAVKTREDWEQLFEVTDVELQEEKEVTRQQRIVIAEQDSMIQAQLARLKALAADIMEKEKELAEKVKTLLMKEKAIETKDREIRSKEQEIREQRAVIAEQEQEVKQQKEVLAEQEQQIVQRESEIEVKSQKIAEQDEKIAIQLEAIQKQKIVIAGVAVALLLMLGLAYFIYVNYRNKKRANQLLEEKNVRITAQKEEIQKQKEVAEMQRDQIAYQKKHITDSIHYAQKIQRAILPSLELFSDELDHFVLYKPRDIVSGDFYWVDRIENKQIIIAADCTGHGVPGAFMSMLGVSLLNEIIINRNVLAPHEILNRLRNFVIDSLNQQRETTEVKDGMDMTVSVIDFDQDKLFFAGANNPLYHIRKGELTQYKPDKMPVAIHERMEEFNMVTVDLEKGDTFYTFSDGYVDQFGGPNQKKFLSKNFRRVLLEIQDLPMYEQGKKLDEIFEEYKADIEQVDDVVVIGVRY